MQLFSNKQNEVALVIPPFFSPFGIMVPIGLLSLVEVLKSSGIQSQIFDFHLAVVEKQLDLDLNCVSKVVDEILNCKPRIVAFSVQCVNMPVALLLAQEIKRRNNLIKLVFGGPQALAFSEIDPKDIPSYIDSYFLGSEEEKFIQYCQQVLCVSQQKRNDDYVPFPDYHSINKDILKKYPSSGLVDNARGCFGNCKFCSETKYWGSKLQTRDVKSIVDHIEMLNKDFGVRRFEFAHDNFFQSKEKTHELMEAITTRSLDVLWDCRVRVDDLSLSVIKKLKKAGCRSVLLGIENLTNRNVLKHQFLQQKEVDQIISLLRKQGIAVSLSFICGFPAETPESFQALLNYALKQSTKPDTISHVHKYCPLPFTSAHDGHPLYYEEKDISDMVISGRCTRSLQKQLNEVILSHPILCRGFYSINTTLFYKGSLGIFLEKFNHLLQYYPRTLSLITKELPITKATVRLYNAINRSSKIDGTKIYKHKLLKDTFAFERAKKQSQLHHVIVTKLKDELVAQFSRNRLLLTKTGRSSDYLFMHDHIGECHIHRISRKNTSVLKQLRMQLKMERKHIWQSTDYL